MIGIVHHIHKEQHHHQQQQYYQQQQLQQMHLSRAGVVGVLLPTVVGVVVDSSFVIAIHVYVEL